MSASEGKSYDTFVMLDKDNNKIPIEDVALQHARNRQDT